MPSYYNRVVLMGNVTKNLERRVMPSGVVVTEFGLAINDRRKGSDGKMADETSFFDVALYGRIAEIACQYLSKGSNILVEGRLRQEVWESKGQRKTKVRVIGEKMQVIGGGSMPSPPPASTVKVARPAGSAEPRPSEPENSASPKPEAEAETEPQPASKPVPGESPHGPPDSAIGYDEPDIPF